MVLKFLILNKTGFWGNQGFNSKWVLVEAWYNRTRPHTPMFPVNTKLPHTKLVFSLLIKISQDLFLLKLDWNQTRLQTQTNLKAEEEILQTLNRWRETSTIIIFSLNNKRQPNKLHLREKRVNSPTCYQCTFNLRCLHTQGLPRLATKLFSNTTSDTYRRYSFQLLCYVKCPSKIIRRCLTNITIDTHTHSEPQHHLSTAYGNFLVGYMCVRGTTIGDFFTFTVHYCASWCNSVM